MSHCKILSLHATIGTRKLPWALQQHAGITWPKAVSTTDAGCRAQGCHTGRRCHKGGVDSPSSQSLHPAPGRSLTHVMEATRKL